MKIFKIMQSIIIVICTVTLIYGLISHQNDYSYIFTLIIAIVMIPEGHKLYKDIKQKKSQR